MTCLAGTILKLLDCLFRYGHLTIVTILERQCWKAAFDIKVYVLLLNIYKNKLIKLIEI